MSDHAEFSNVPDLVAATAASSFGPEPELSSSHFSAPQLQSPNLVEPPGGGPQSPAEAVGLGDAVELRAHGELADGRGGDQGAVGLILKRAVRRAVALFVRLIFPPSERFSFLSLNLSLDRRR